MTHYFISMNESSSEFLDVLFITEACSAGVRRHLELIIPALQMRGIRCGLFAFSARADEDFLLLLEELAGLSCPVDFLEIKYNFPPVNLLCAYFRLKAMLERYQPANIHLQAGWAGILGRTLFSQRSIKSKVIYSPHSFGFHPGASFARRKILPWLEKQLSRKTDAYLFIAEDELEDAKKLQLQENKFHLAQNAMPENFHSLLMSSGEAQLELQISSDCLNVLVPCRLAWQKGLDILFEALAISKRSFPEKIIFHLCGTGPQEKELRKLADNLEIQELLCFQGNVSRLWQKLKAFDFGILPSRYEGLSYSLLECLAAELPLLVSNINANMISPEINNFEAENAGSLAEKLVELSKHKLDPKYIKLPCFEKQIQQLMKLYNS